MCKITNEYPSIVYTLHNTTVKNLYQSMNKETQNLSGRKQKMLSEFTGQD